jgi:hypothetical protein
MSFAGSTGRTGTVTLTRAQVLQALAGSPDLADILAQNIIALSQADISALVSDPTPPGTMMLMLESGSVPTGYTALPVPGVLGGRTAANTYVLPGTFTLPPFTDKHVDQNDIEDVLGLHIINAPGAIPLTGTAVVPVLGSTLYSTVAAPPYGFRWIVKQ